MKSINSTTLLQQLENDVREVVLQATRLEGFSPRHLQTQPATDKWSVAQVLEHLNFYARYYLPAIENKLHLHTTVPQKNFKPGWLGNYFTRLMRPGVNNQVARKMKAPKNALPSVQPNGTAQLQEFLQHQHHLLQLLHIAQTAHIGKLRIATSLSKWITLKLGDTFRFLIAHEQRHFIQIARTLEAVTPANRVAAFA
jgi:DinB superfamily